MTGTEIERLFVSLGIDPAGVVRGAAEAIRATADMAAQMATSATAGAAAMASAFAMASASVIRSIEDAVNRAIDSFANFEEGMARVRGLAGASADQTRAWGKEILALAPAFGQAPRQLADAMFFISSAGLRGEAATAALTESAKAAAAGLGDVKTVAHAVTFALSAYAGTGLTAARATDIYVAAAREGNLSVEALAHSIGTVLPVASAVGVSLEEVAGTMAVLTHTGSSVAAAGISVQSMLMALQKPGKDAQDTLASVGLTFAELRRMAREPEGLIKVMRKLDEAFGGNQEALAHIIPNIRALRGSLSILSQDGKIVDGVMRGVRDSTGATDDAFATMKETLSFAFKSAKEGATVAAIEMGEILAPTIKDVARIASEVLKWFRSWPPVLKAAAAITALVAAGVLSVAAAIAVATLGIVAAGVAFNLAFGGIGFLIGFVVTGAVALYAAVAAVVGVTWGVGAAVAYAAGLFDEMRAAAVRAWEWLHPVRQALVQLFRTVALIGAAAFESIKRTAAAVWGAIVAQANIDWDSIRDAMLTAVIAAEYALLNLGKVWGVVEAGSKYAVEVMRGHLAWLTDDVIPAFGSWLVDKLTQIVILAWSAAKAAGIAVVRTMIQWFIDSFVGMFDNFGRIFKAVDWNAMWVGMKIAARVVLADIVGKVADILNDLPNIARNPALFVVKWKAEEDRRDRAARDAPVIDRREIELAPLPVQDVRRVAAQAKAAANAAADHANRGGALDVRPFELPDRVEGLTERSLREEFERRKDALLIGFAEFKRLRLAQFAEADRLAKKAAEEAGKAAEFRDDKEWHRHGKEKEKADAVLFESAEAAARIAKYREMLAGSFVDAQQVEAQKEARIAADRATALENELRLTQQIAEVRRDMNRREENLGVRTIRPESPAFGEFVSPRPLDPLDEAYPQRFGERDLRRRQSAPRVPEIDPAVMEAIREANRSSERFQSRLDDDRRRQLPDLGGNDLGEQPRPVSRGPRRDQEQEALPVRQPEVRAASADQADIERQRQMIALLTELVNLQRAQARKPPLTIEETNA